MPSPMIETSTRSRKEPLKPINMEDIKIEFVDLCVLPSEGMNYVEIDSSDAGSPAATMEITIPSSGSSEAVRPRKRAKLDHLSPEEKAQHRKMMNRISAQSARDRQKALMIQQEATIKTLQTTTETLKKQNAALNAKNTSLRTENDSLKQENQRLATLVMELEAKLKAASQTQNPTVNSTSFQEPSVDSSQLNIKLEEKDESKQCCGSSLEPAEGTSRAASEFVTHSSSLDNVFGDLDSPEILRLLGEFSEKIISGEQQLPELEQLSSAAEALASQMVIETKTERIGSENAGLTVSVPIKNDVNQGSQFSTSVEKTNLSLPLAVKIVQPATLPLQEPEALQLSGFNVDSKVLSSVSPVPDAIFGNDKISKHELMDFDEPKYYNDLSDFDMWTPDGMDSALFPELIE